MLRFLSRCTLALMLMLVLGVYPLLAQDEASEPVTVVDANGDEVVIEDTSRIVTIGGSVTEIVFELGAGDQVVARDDSSLYPPEVTELESVGYIRRLSAEPVLSLNPSLIITTEDVGPPEAVEQLKAAGVTMLVVPTDESIDSVIEKVDLIATALGQDQAGTDIINQIEQDYAEAQSLLENVETSPSVMFVYARGAGSVSVAGTNTGAARMIELAGGENAVTAYEGYRPITAESVVAAAPDVILVMTRGLGSLDGVDGLVEQPGIAQTPAGENRRVVAMPDLYLLGFSTRIGTAVKDLTYLLHEELDAPLLTYLRADGRFTTLTSAIETAGQTTLLNQDGPFTLFAPTDAAFDAVPSEMLEGLMSSTISLQAVLSYHILEGRMTAEDVRSMDGESIQTLYSDGTLSVSTLDNGVTLNGEATVIEADHTAANGVIHVIDSVLLPERPQ